MPNIDLSYCLKKYLENRPPFLAVIRAKEAFLYQKYLPLKKPILDVGCGDGFFAKLAIGQVDIGLDLENSRMGESQNIYKQKITYDGLTIPLKDNSVSTVICNSVLEHVGDLDQVLSEIHRVLKPGGLFICPVMALPWEHYLLGQKYLGLWYANWLRHKQEHHNLLTRGEWVKHFKAQKFKLRQEIGHLSESACHLIELLHYWSLPNLILYKLTGRWTHNRQYILPISPDKILKILSEDVDPSKSGAIFYVWQK